MGQVLAVISGKGGTGKTTLCAGIAACLAAEGQRVLCIDCDIGLRNLDISLGMTELCSVAFTDVMAGRYALSDATPHPSIPNLFLLTAPVCLTEAQIDAAAFAALLDRVRAEFDWCLIDAAAGIGPAFRLATDSADRVFVVSTPDPASMRDAAHTAGLLPARLSGCAQLVVNRIRPKMFSRMRLTVDDMMDSVGLPLLGVVPEDSAVVLAAASGQALILYSDRNASRACLHIARRLCGRKMPLLKL